MGSRDTTLAHEALYQEFADLLKKYTAHMGSLEVLAVASNLVGKLIALQDQRLVTPALAMKVVAENIELGNAQVLAGLAETKGSA